MEPTSIYFEVIIAHKTPFNGRILSNLLDSIYNAAEAASIQQIDEIDLSKYLPITPDQIEIAKRNARNFTHENKKNALWIESVESGSSKFRGKILAVGLSVLGFFCS